MLLNNQLNETKKVFGLLCCLCLPALSRAQDAAPAAAYGNMAATDEYQVTRYILTGMSILLLFVIAALANAVISTGKIFWEKERKKIAKIIEAAGIICLSLLATGAANAQELTNAPVAKGNPVPFDIYLLLILVTLEFTVILVLVHLLMRFLQVKPEKQKVKTERFIKWKNLFQKMNQTVPVEDEAQLDLAHDYDGIRELDNKVPAWWRYSFYASILFGVIYLYRMFGSGSLPDQLQELEQANRVAAIKMEIYLKNAANNVDEHSVTMADEAGITEGALLYSKNCLACHGDQGQGGVGPNLTDEYWMHKGGLKDIFHTIKYGVPEKGMKAWKDDFSPVQIARISSYIMTLKGTDPPGAKEPQGQKYTEEEATGPADSTLAHL